MAQTLQIIRDSVSTQDFERLPHGPALP